MLDTNGILQRAAVLELGNTEHDVHVSYPVAPNVFMETLHTKSVLEYVDADGMRTRVQGEGGGQPFTRPPATWHIYAAGTGYSEAYEKPDRIREHMWMFFTLHAPLPPISEKRFAAIADPEGRLAGYCRSIHAITQRGEVDGDLACHGLMWAVFGEILMATRHGGDGTPANPWQVRSTYGASSESLLQRVDHLVLAQLADPPSLAQLAEGLHLSVSGLSHRLKAESRMTVVERIRWLRVREARRLLGAGMSVKAVTQTMGFSSAAYFSRVFRDIAGISPNEYRMQFRGKAEIEKEA